MPGMVGSHENWGNFKCHKWGELLRHSHLARTGMPAFAWTPVLPEETPEGALSAQLRRSKAGVCYVRNTSTPAVRSAQIGVVPGWLGERVISDPLPPFLVGPGR